MSDYVLATTIDSSGAVTGANAFNSSLASMRSNVSAFKAEVSGVSAAFNGSASKMVRDVEALSSAINGLSIRGFENVVNGAVTAREQIMAMTNAAKSANLVSFGHITEQLRQARAAADSLASALLNIHEPNTSRNAGPSRDTQPQVNATQLAADLATSMGGFQSSLAEIKHGVSAFSNVLESFAGIFRGFGASIGGAGSHFDHMASSLRGLEEPIGMVAPGLTRISVALASMSSGGESIARVVSSLYRASGASSAVSDLGAALELLGGSFRGFNATSFKNEFDKLKASLGDTATLERAAQSIEKIGEAAAHLRDIKFEGLDKVSTSIAAATTAVHDFSKAIADIRSAALIQIADAFIQIANDIKKMVDQLALAPSAIIKIEKASSTLNATLGKIDFTKFAQSARDALPSISQLEALIVPMSAAFARIEASLRSINQLTTRFARQLSDAQALAAQLGQVMAQNTARQAGGGGQVGFFGSLAASALQAARGVATIGIASGFVATNLAAMATGAVGRLTGVAGSAALMGRAMGNAGQTIHGALVPAIGQAIAGAAGFTRTLAVGALGGIAGGISSIASQMGRFTASMIGFGALNHLTSLPGHIVNAGDAFVSLQGKIGAVTKSQAEANEMMRLISITAQTNRVDIEAVGSNYVRLYGVLHPLGASMRDVQDIMDGVSLSLKRSGATADETKRAFTQFEQGIQKGTFDLQDIKSLEQSAPSFIRAIEKELGLTIGKFHELQKEGGKVAQDLNSKFVGAAANIGIVLRDKISTIPRTVADAFVQLGNEFTLLVGSIQKSSGFIDRINSSIDRMRVLLSGSAMQSALATLIDAGVTVSESFVKMLTTGETFAVQLDSLTTKFKNLGSIIRSAVADVLTLGFFKFSSANIERLDKETSDRKAGYGSSPFGQAYDPAAANAARIKAGLDDVINGYKTMPPVELRFSTEQAKSEAIGVLGAVEKTAKALSMELSNFTREGNDATISSELRNLEILAEKAGVIREQFSSGKISTEAASQAESVMASIDEISARISLKMSERIAEASKQVSVDVLTPGDGLAVVTAGMTDLEKEAANAQKAISSIADMLRSLMNANVKIGVNIVGVPDAPTQAGRTISTPPPVKTKKNGGGGGEDTYQQKIKTLADQVELKRAELLLDEDAIRAARDELELDRALNESMIKGNSIRQDAIQDLMIEKQAMEKQLEWAKQFKQLGSEIGNTISDSFLSGAKAGETFGQSAKKAFAGIVEQVAKMLILKPLINSFSNSLGKIGGEIGAASGGNASGGLFSLLGIGGGAGNAAAATTFSTAVATSGAEFAIGIGATATELMTAVTTSAIEFAATITSAAASAGAALQTGAVGSGVTSVGSSGIGSLVTSLSIAAANGHAFSNASSGPIGYFASGDVFNAPTAFSYGGGKLGVMGEAGPEAVMPLTRGSDGKLGVKGGGAPAQAQDNRVYITVTGDSTDETLGRMADIAHHAISQRTGGIVDRANATIIKRNRNNGNTLSR